VRYALYLLVVAAYTGPTSAADNWQSLFNGHDLRGWHANFDSEAFTVEDGALRIEGLGRKAAHLFYVGDNGKKPEPFKDFELQATVRAEPNANSGVFIHTDYQLRNEHRHLANGYEIQLNSSPHERLKTGSLYAVVDVLESPVDETEWFELHITVKDKRIVVKVNDEVVVDYTEPPNVERPADRKGRVLSANGGGIALQAHDPQSVWYFKAIAVQRL
jgi:hypothetical protein